MTASLETLVVAAYVFATSVSIPRPGPAGLITDHELIALGVAQAATGICSDRQFLGVIDRLLPGWFPHLPDQTQYNRRLRRLAPWITVVQLGVAEWLAEGRIRLVDGTLIACANYPGCQSKSEFAGHASYYCPSKSLFGWGMRLVLIADIKGTPVGYDLVGPKTGQERESAWELACAQPDSFLFADGGFWGAEYERTMSLIDVTLITPDQHKLGARPPVEVARPASASSSSRSSATSKARCASITTSPRPSPDSCSGSLNAYSPSLSPCSSTSSPAAHHALSPPTTDDEPTSSL
jgi:hypothetical protein